MGIINMKITEKNGRVKKIIKVTGEENQQIMLITNKGTAIRVPTSGISLVGRATQGVRLIRLDEGDRLEDISLIEEQEGGEDGEAGADESGVVSEPGSEASAPEEQTGEDTAKDATE